MFRQAGIVAVSAALGAASAAGVAACGEDREGEVRIEGGTTGTTGTGTTGTGTTRTTGTTGTSTTGTSPSRTERTETSP